MAAFDNRFAVAIRAAAAARTFRKNMPCQAFQRRSMYNAFNFSPFRSQGHGKLLTPDHYSDARIAIKTKKYISIKIALIITPAIASPRPGFPGVFWLFDKPTMEQIKPGNDVMP